MQLLSKLALTTALWLSVATGALACDPVEGQTVSLTSGVVGAIEKGFDFDSGKDLWFVNVKDGKSSNGCLIDAIVVSSQPKTCKIDSRFAVEGPLEIVPDLVAGGESLNIKAAGLVCK